MEQQRVRKQSKAQQEDQSDDRSAPAKDAKDAKIEEDKQYANELLDEIDDLLESNAEVFVREYVQQGGE